MMSRSRSIKTSSNTPAAYEQDLKQWTRDNVSPRFSRKSNVVSPTLANNKGQHEKTNFVRLIIPRVLLFLFHPAFIVLAIMVVLIGLRVSQLASAFGSSSSSPSSVKPRTLGFVERGGPSHTATDALPASKLHKRLKRSATANEDDNNNSNEDSEAGSRSIDNVDIDTGGPKGRMLSGGVSPSRNSQSSSDSLISELDEYKRPTDRRPARSSLDDMLLDGETPVPASLCLNEELKKELNDTQYKHLQKLLADGKELSEHMEDCETTDDCLQLSPFQWAKEGTGETCWKKTYLRCESHRKMCVCQDKFDLRWDTDVEQSTYQWNPITKTCYVRGTNPCKLDIPCAPGTVCRSTVSFSYNTPPIQRNCECENINHLIYAGSQDWWYCGEYSQRTWLFDMDNIKKWKDKPFHLYGRMRYASDYNFTSKPTDDSY